ncbi:MAG: 8-oxoguanine DNA glycosylase [Candidatus Syntropharchaeia archaeon]
MSKLIERIEELKKDEISERIRRRMEEFEDLHEKEEKYWFSELCFCILTANSSAELGIRIQDKLGPEGFLETPLGKLSEILKEEGHRFYKKRAKFIVEARKFDIKENVISFENEREARRWLVENVRGIGYKEGSHFLRNVGYEDVSISKRERY